MGVREIDRFLEQWQMDVRDLHRRLIPAPTPRERGRWHALRLVKADEQKREAFAAEYATLSDEAWRTGARIFFAGEAHFRADAELRGEWVLKGEPAPVSTRAGFGGLAPPELWRKGRLLLGSVPGDR